MAALTIEFPQTVWTVEFGGDEIVVAEVTMTGGTGGTGGGFDGVHNDLDGRSTADAHPISAITGLTAALEAGGASALADLTDVDVETDPPAPDDVLAWDGTNWTPATLDGGSGLALGETSSTAYRGDRGKTAYDHSQVTTGNPHGTTAADVGAQPSDADLTAIAGLSPSNDDFLQRKAGAWTNRTITQVKADLGVSLAIAGSPTAYSGWFCPPGHSQSADAVLITVANGTVYYVACFTPHAITMTAARSRVTSSVAATSVRRLVCSVDANLMPSAVLWQDTFDASSTGTKDTTGLSVTIPAGWFLIGARPEGGSPTIVVVGQIGPMVRSNMVSGESTPADGFLKAATGSGTISGTPPQPDTVWSGTSSMGCPFSMRWTT